jgi:SAM-dependent methyltransferase
MNDDIISEVYKGQAGTEGFQERSRRRIDWMVSQARGERVLDVGCSQGIASILAGREGFETVGVDVQESRIEYANADLAKEPDAVRERVSFVLADGYSLDFGADSFDTVLLGEVLEHLQEPGSMLAEARRVLKPGGRIVITTPFGVLHHHDHRQTFFPADLFDLVSAHFGITSAGIVERYFRIVGEKGASSGAGVLASLNASAYDTVRDLQEELAELRRSSLRQDTRIKDLTDQVRLAEKQFEKAEQARGKLQEAWRETKATLQNESAARSSLERQYKSVATELRRAAQQARLASRTAEELERARALIRRKEREVSRLQHRLDVSTWKLASLRQRRWWKLGAELGALRRNPRTILSLPARVLRSLRDKPERLPRPSPPSELESAATGHAGAEASSEPRARVDWIPPVVPRRDIAAATILGSELSMSLAHEMQTFPLAMDRWKSQLQEIRPSLLIVDASIDEEWPWDELFQFAKEAGIRTALWNTRSDRTVEDVESRFDLVRDADSVEIVQPRTHNPIGSRRASDVAVIDVANLVLADSRFADPTSLARAGKRYKVLIEVGRPSPAELAPLVATATPIISVTDDPSFLGLRVGSEEEAVALEQSLLRSEVLRARMTHPLMRRVLREPGIPAGVRSLLGETESQWPHIDVMVATKRPQQLETVFDNLGRQTYPHFSLWLITHGVSPDRGKVQELADRAGVNLATVVEVDESVILGDVFNIGFGETQSDIIAKMDDDDFYGAEYLWDLYSAFDFSGAEVAGKWAHYVYLEGADTTIYRFKDYEYRFTDVVAISTLMMQREVLEVEKFPAMAWGSGSVFLRALGAQGGRVFAGDRWNYLYRRGSDGDRNTFPISDMKLMSNSDVVCRGVNLDEVVL